MAMTQSIIQDQLSRWSAAERAGNSEQLAPLLEDRFMAVGPLGFVLGKRQWLERFDNGLKYSSLDLEDIDVRQFDNTAVLIGRHVQAGRYQVRVVDGQFRTTQVWVHEGDSWRLASLQLSPIAAPDES